MKINWNKKYTVITVYACAVAAVTVLVIFLGINITGVGDLIGRFMKLLNPLFVGFIIAYLLNSLMRFCENVLFSFIGRKKAHPRLKRIFALMTTYIVYAVIITVMVWMVIPQVVSSYNDFMGMMSFNMSSLESFVKKITAAFPFIDIDKLLEYLNEWVSNSYSLIQNVSPYITGFFAAFVDQLKNALLGIVISIYFLFSKEKLRAQLKKLMYAFLPRKSGDSVASFLQFTDNTFGVFITGKLLDSLIVGILTFIVLAICNMPYYQLLSVVIGVTNIVPLFGIYVGAAFCAFILLLINPVKALWFIIIIIIIQQIDGNLIGPKVLGKTTGLSSLGIIVAITVMGGLFGVAGMLFGIPLCAMIYIGFERMLNRRIAKKKAAAGVPDDIDAYENLDDYGDAPGGGKSGGDAQ